MKKALLATDASSASLRAAGVLGNLARLEPEMLITVLHVVPLPEVLGPAAPLTLPNRLDDYMNHTAQEVLARTVEALGVSQERVKAIGVIGLADDSILIEANQGGYDLIVMGRRGLSTLKEMLLGSVSQGVLHRTTIPILFVP